MSVETWKAEYYEDVADAKTWTDLRCFNHTRTKYIGTRKENLEKHNVSLRGKLLLGNNITNIGVFSFGCYTCSLCIKHPVGCDSCPICIHTGFSCEIHISAYKSLVREKNPEPMIALMDELIARCDENGKYIPKNGGE